MLTKWSCKTAYVLSYAALHKEPVGVEHFRHLALRSAVPDGVGVFAGSHTATGAASFSPGFRSKGAIKNMDLFDRFGGSDSWHTRRLLGYAKTLSDEQT